MRALASDVDKDRMRQLDVLFHPRSVAVLGASASLQKFGSRFLQALIDFGFKGKIYPVNSTGEGVCGLRAYRSVLEIPDEIDCADIMVPARYVPQALEECLAKGVKGAQIFSSGFAETGEEGGRELEGRLKALSAKGIRIIGPNCFGVYCPAAGHTLLPGGQFPKESGPVAFLTQSGGHAVEFARQADGRGIRFSKIVSYGNACDVNEADLLEYMLHDPETKIITMYLEGPRDGARFFRLLREMSTSKPVLIWKAGLTPAGSRAVHSHTGSLGGEAAVWDAVFKQTAAVRVSNLEEMGDTVEAFLSLPSKTGRRIGMVSGGGAIGVAAADACSKVGLEMEPLPPDVQEELRRVLPPAGTATRNPVDIGAPLVPPPLFHRVLEIVAGVDSVDTVIATQALFYVFRANGPLLAGRDAVDALMRSPVDVRDRFCKPVIVILPVGGEEVEAIDAERQRREARDAYRRSGILSMTTLERATRAIANVVKYYERGGAPV